MASSDPIAAAIADQAARSRAARAHIRELLGDFVRAAAAEPSAQARDFLAAARGVLAALEAAWQHQPTETFSRQATATEGLLEAGHSGYQRLAAAPGLTSMERARRSAVAQLLGDALCTLRTGIPGVESVRSLSALMGASNCSSTGGGAPMSLHRNLNVMDQIVAVNTADAAVRISSVAAGHIAVLRVDPLAAPDSSGVVAALYAVSQGVVAA